MQRHRQKSSANAEMGIGMLTVNLVSVLKKHHSADVVTICMLLHQYAVPTTLCVKGSNPFPGKTG